MSAERMSAYFGRARPAILAIVLSRDERATLDEVEGAIRGGADGAFLVADRIGHQELLGIAQAVLARHPKLFVGVRCLDLRPQDVFCRLPASVRGVWTDAPLPGTNGTDAREALAAIAQARHESGWTGLHFVTVAAPPAAGGAGTPAQEPGAKATTARAILSAAGAPDVIVLTGPSGLETPAADVVDAVRSIAGDRPVATVLEQPGPKGLECVLRIDWPAPTAHAAIRRIQSTEPTKKLVS